jgi:hypothetical protein
MVWRVGPWAQNLLCRRPNSCPQEARPTTLSLSFPLPQPPAHPQTHTDFTYSQASFSGPISWPGRTHEGFSRLAAYLWTTGLQAAVQELVMQPGSGVEHVVVTGHSMGAGVGTLLSYTIHVRRQCIHMFMVMSWFHVRVLKLGACLDVCSG